jgi:hypothetical protein
VLSNCPATIYLCRGQVSELLSASNTSHREADALRQQLKGKDLELEHMTLALAGALSQEAGAKRRRLLWRAPGQSR